MQKGTFVVYFEVRWQHLLGGTEKNTKTWVRIVGDLAKIGTKHLPHMSKTSFRQRLCSWNNFVNVTCFQASLFILIIKLASDILAFQRFIN
jgi:hypothetical protein